MGFVARDNSGEFLEGRCGFLEHATSPIHVEALAALNSLQRVAQLGMTRIVLETGVANLHKGLTCDDWDRSIEGVYFTKSEIS